ncbi:MAG: SMP-30/gluconolactonase/LRE family protein [Labilithrix sp.]|nr:SMP-30/gluconolactonase/LRE family protein [Labilithrix sp.]
MSSQRRRLALVLAALPLVFYAYACGDDPTSPGIEEEDGGGQGDGGGPGDDDSGGNPGTDSGDPGDGGKLEDAGDGGDGGDEEPACLGNPLTADGGTADGGAITVPFATLKAIGTGNFLDGPQFVDDGSDGGALVYSEVTAQRIVRTGPDGGTPVQLRATGAATSLPIGNATAGGFIYTTLARTTGGGGVLRMLLDGGSPTAFDGGPANAPNDAVGSSKGFVYFTDPAFQSGASTGVYRLAPDGGVTTITSVAGGNTNRADGIALSADETALYVGFFDTQRVSRYTVDANGVASNPQILPFTTADNPTGIAIDVAGNLWIAENGGGTNGRIEVFSPAGTKWGEIPFPDAKPTGIAFGGKDNKTAYITTERGDDPGTLYVLPTRCVGVR